MVRQVAEVTGCGPGPVILVSNRGPVEFTRRHGERKAERGNGGLVTALSGLADHLDDAVWICAALSDEDVAVARENAGPFALDGQRDGTGLQLRMIELDPDAQHKFYAIIANPLLWFIQHYLWDLSCTPNITRREIDAFENGYVAVNAHFAEAVIEAVNARGGRATVMVHDYHFYLVGARVRAQCPDVFLHHFVHIPWPHPDAWRVLPPSMRRAIFDGLLGNDVVAFHSERYARNFVLGCQELGLEADVDRLAVHLGDRAVVARWYPISVDPSQLEATARSEAVADHWRRLAANRRDHLILRVDRADLSKNIVRGFQAFDTLLDDHPELARRITFLALLQHSREDVAEYVEYLERIRRVVADVNLKHGTTDWQPIELNLAGGFDQVVAAYKLFDVLMVNAIFDGMNLVAKEAVLVNENDGVLALSENAGAYEELGAFAVTLYPFDIQQQADALFVALSMDRRERRDRQKACATIVRENTVAKWLNEQMLDIRSLRRQ
jgi:trehalose 6-phosphate synthase